MKPRMSNTPKASRTKGNDDRTKGACPECGKGIRLLNNTGMISSHQRAATARKCPGVGMAPSKACDVMYNPEWKPARRTS